MNSHFRLLMIAALVLLVSLASAAADTTSAFACRAKLPAVGQQMFDAVAPHVRPHSDLAALLRAHIRPLVISGALSRADAQANAHAVGACLKMLQD